MRNEAVTRGIILIIVGAIIGGFGYADMMYYLTELPVEVDEVLYYIGGILSLAGFIYLVYGLIAKRPSPPSTAMYVPSPPPTTYAPSPPPQPQAQTPRCPTCNQPLELIQQYNRWYCRTCQKYV
jgi:hypothetical protein